MTNKKVKCFQCNGLGDVFISLETRDDIKPCRCQQCNGEGYEDWPRNRNGWDD